MQKSILEQAELYEPELFGTACSGKKAVCLVGQPWKMINSIRKKISDCMEPSQPTFIPPSQLGRHADSLLQMPIQVGQPVKRERMLL